MPYFGLIFLLLLVLAIVDIAGADEGRIRGLPRTLWVFVVLLLPLAGSIAWFVAGRPIPSAAGRRAADARGFPEYEKPGRFVPQDPAADAEFLWQCRERAEAQRRAAKQARMQRDRNNSDPD